MKKATFISFSLIILFSSACHKDDYKDKDGTAQCTYNGNIWETDEVICGYSNTGEKDTISINLKKNNNNVRKEQILITNIPNNLSKQRIYRGIDNRDTLIATYLTTDIEYDASCDAYRVYEPDSLNNWVQITKEENNYGEIWGNFSITFIKVDSCEGTPYPDTVRIRDGVFHIWKIIK